MHLISGIGSLVNLNKILQARKLERVLLVTGKESYSACGAQKVIDRLLGGFEVERFSDFSVNPKIGDAIKGAKRANRQSSQVIVAVGGGSVLDMAKLIKGIMPSTEFAEEVATGKLAMSENTVPIVAIPTTAGSGSEETHFAVVYVEGQKYSLADNSLKPDYVILDGMLCGSAGSYQRACNVLDATSQAIESAWSVGSTAASFETAVEALGMCRAYGAKFVKSNQDLDLAQNMLMAANKAGKAINITKTTAAHAWSYGFTAKYGLAHGHAVWMTLPRIFALHIESGNRIRDTRGEGHLERVMRILCETLKITEPRNAELFLNDWLSHLDINIDKTWEGIVEPGDREVLAQGVNLERMMNNPVIYSHQQIEWVFRQWAR